MRQRLYWVYVMSHHNHTLYIGVTNSLLRRVVQHKRGGGSEFTEAYGLNMLVYNEWYSEIAEAISREKQLKGWRRSKKLALTLKSNPNFEDLWPSLWKNW